MIIDTQTGERVDVCFKILERSDARKYDLTKQNGWFGWRKEIIKEERKVFGIFVPGQDDIEGVISIEETTKNQLIHIGLMESAPRNKFNHPDQKYAGVGKNLLCLAIDISFQRGFEGYVGLEAKINRNENYYLKLGADKARGGVPPYYYFRTDQSYKLINRYMPGGVRWCQN